jgi:hypothetical protein
MSTFSGFGVGAGVGVGCGGGAGSGIGGRSTSCASSTGYSGQLYTIGRFLANARYMACIAFFILCRVANSISKTDSHSRLWCRTFHPPTHTQAWTKTCAPNRPNLSYSMSFDLIRIPADNRAVAAASASELAGAFSCLATEWLFATSHVCLVTGGAWSIALHASCKRSAKQACDPHAATAMCQTPVASTRCSSVFSGMLSQGGHRDE